MLLKEEYNLKAPKKFIEDFNKSRIISLEDDVKDVLLYHKKNQGKKPTWLSKLVKIISDSGIEKKVPSNSSCGVNLFIKVENRIFAVNYGVLARYNIKKEAIDDTFGIYTAAKIFYGDGGNSTLKSAQSRVIESNPVNKQRQYGEGIQPDEVLLSMEDNEALRELTILSEESDFTRLIGKYNSLNVQFDLDPKDIPYIDVLPQKLGKLLKIYNSVSDDEIKNLFKGLFPIRDKKIIEELFKELNSRITKGDHDFFLFEPELDFDYSSVSDFTYVIDDSGYSDKSLNLAQYLKHQPSPQQKDWEGDSLQVVDEDGKRLKEWRVLDCLYGEMSFNGVNYILSHGDWFSIEKDKYDRVIQATNAVISKKDIVTQDIKDKTKADIAQFEKDNPKTKIDKERIFNKRFCEKYDGELFDEISKQIKVYEDKFEVCDVFLPKDKEFIHAKYNYGASALSHMFNQGFVSASCHAKYSDVFTDKANAHIKDKKKFIPKSPNGCVVHYLIINSRKENRLTFFSKMVLEDKISQLEAMQYRVKLTWADNVY